VQPLHAKVNGCLRNPKNPLLPLLSWVVVSFSWPWTPNQEDDWSTSLGYTTDGTLLLRGMSHTCE
jgi:hypothetical protein